MRNLLATLLVVALLNGCAIIVDNQEDSAESEGAVFFNPPAVEGMDLPFSIAVRADDFLIMSGILGNDEGGLVSGGIVPETHRIFVNMRRVLEANGLGLKDVVKCTAMLDEMSDFAEFNAIYTSYFEKPRPTRSTFGADGLALGGAIELECWALIPEDDD